MNTTRRKFLGMLGAATAMGSTTAFAFAGETEFRDINPDNEYVIFTYDDGVVRFRATPRDGAFWIRRFCSYLQEFAYSEYKGALEQAFAKANTKEWGLMPIYGADSKEIDITEAWLREFWRRHNVI